MTTQEFKRAFAIADERGPNGRCKHDLSGEDIGRFDRYGLSTFQPTVATVRQVARLMRWQAMSICSLKGQSPWNMDELNEMRTCLRHKVTIID